MLEQNGWPFWEVFWQCLNAFDVIRVRAPAKEFNDAKKYGPHAELHFFLLRNVRCETDPIAPGHVIIEASFSRVSFTQLEGLFLPASNDPLSQETIDDAVALFQTASTFQEAKTHVTRAKENIVNSTPYRAHFAHAIFSRVWLKTELQAQD